MIVSDSSPLIYLARVGRLGLLRDLHHQVLAPDGVRVEVMEEGRPEVVHLKQAERDGWLKFERIRLDPDDSSQAMGKVDAQVLNLAERRGVPLITNDRAVYQCARSRGIKVSWLTLIAEEGVRAGLLSAADAEIVLTDMIGAGLRVRSQVLAQLLIRIKRSDANTERPGR